MARYQLTFGPPIDTRKVPCDRCGLMDASVTRSQASGLLLCSDDLQLELDEIIRSINSE